MDSDGPNSSPCGRYPNRSDAGVYSTLPLSAPSTPARMRSNVVLPLPFGPTSPARSPRLSPNDTDDNTGSRP